MSTPASAGRLRVALVLALSGLLALGSFWVLELMRKSSEEERSERARDAADYTVENFNFIRMTKTGEARYNISGKKLEHFPNDDSFQITAPRLHSLATARAPMTVTAERAVVDNAGRKVHLYQSVQMDRPASAQEQAMTMQTDYLQILPDEDVMKTDKPVQIAWGNSTVTATGMMFDNTARRIEMHRVHGVSQPASTGELQQ